MASRTLLIEDEDALRGLVARYLERLGFEVYAASSGEQALDEFSAASQSFDLVIADLTLPGLSGIDVARRMLELRPDQRILLCSGYPFDPAVLDGVPANQITFLQKPFMPAMLADSLRSLIATADAAPAPLVP
jgi:two-component system cell cycle sensor histidine kinase/response regulator CckA